MSKLRDEVKDIHTLPKNENEIGGIECPIVINIDKRTDRMVQTTYELAYGGFKSYYRLSACVPTEEEVQSNEQSKRTISYRPLKYAKGALGCKNSHIAACNVAINLELGAYLVLEDDVEFTRRNVLKEVNECINFLDKNVCDWDMLFLGLSSDTRPAPYGKIDDGPVFRVASGGTTHAFILRQKAYDTMLNQWKYGTTLEADCCIFQLKHKLKIYCMKNPIAVQRASFSDITNHNADHSNMFKWKVN